MGQNMRQTFAASNRRASHRRARLLRRREGDQRGGVMIEALGLLGVLALATPYVANQVNQRSNEVLDVTAANQMRELTDAAGAYVKANYAAIIDADAATGDAFCNSSPCTFDVDDLIRTGYLRNTFANVNPFGQEYRIVVNRDTFTGGGGDYLEAIVATVPAASGNSRAVDEVRAARVASLIGAGGGYVSNRDGNTGRVFGSGGTWSMDLSDLDITGSGTPTSGHFVSTAAFQENAVVAPYLYREEVPGFPEANEMFADLVLNEHDVLLYEVDDANATGGPLNGPQVATAGGNLVMAGGEMYLTAFDDGSGATGGDFTMAGGTMTIRHTDSTGAAVTDGGIVRLEGGQLWVNRVDDGSGNDVGGTVWVQGSGSFVRTDGGDFVANSIDDPDSTNPQVRLGGTISAFGGSLQSTATYDGPTPIGGDIVTRGGSVWLNRQNNASSTTDSEGNLVVGGASQFQGDITFDHSYVSSVSTGDTVDIGSSPVENDPGNLGNLYMNGDLWAGSSVYARGPIEGFDRIESLTNGFIGSQLWDSGVCDTTPCTGSNYTYYADPSGTSRMNIIDVTQLDVDTINLRDQLNIQDFKGSGNTYEIDDMLPNYIPMQGWLATVGEWVPIPACPDNYAPKIYVTPARFQDGGPWEDFGSLRSTGQGTAPTFSIFSAEASSDRWTIRINKYYDNYLYSPPGALSLSDAQGAATVMTYCAA